jgi:hypothetical protein
MYSGYFPEVCEECVLSRRVRVSGENGRREVKREWAERGERTFPKGRSEVRGVFERTFPKGRSEVSVLSRREKAGEKQANSSSTNRNRMMTLCIITIRIQKFNFFF